MYKKQKLKALFVVSDPAINKSTQTASNCLSKKANTLMIKLIKMLNINNCTVYMNARHLVHALTVYLKKFFRDLQFAVLANKHPSNLSLN